MVGVPALAWWLSGPSSRTAWPIWCKDKRRITTGPITSASPKAVSALTIVRKVR